MPHRSAVADSPNNRDALAAIGRGDQWGFVTLFAKDGTVIAAIGRPLPPPGGKKNYRMRLFSRWKGGAVSGRVAWQTEGMLVATASLRSASRTITADFHHSCWWLDSARSAWAPFPFVRQLTVVSSA